MRWYQDMVQNLETAKRKATFYEKLHEIAKNAYTLESCIRYYKSYVDARNNARAEEYWYE